jgi:capsular polysaccharide biosynthesis protein
MEGPSYTILAPAVSITPLIPQNATGLPVQHVPVLVPKKKYVYWDIRSGYNSQNGIGAKSFIHFQEIFISYLPNARVVGPNGSVITHDHHLLEESLWTWNNWLRNDRTQQVWRLPAPEIINGVAYTVASIYAEGYPHWLTEVLPRLAGLGTLPSGTKPFIIFNKELNPIQEESLTLLGLKDYPRLILNNRHIQISNLFFPGYAGLSGCPHPFGCKWVRNNILSNAGLSHRPSKRLYITRSCAQKRRLINEDEITPLLKQYGFDIVAAEKLSFKEQLELFTQAEAVVAPHGGGLGNLLFAPEKCKVLELLDKYFVSDYYYNLSVILGLDYYYLLGNSVNVFQGKQAAPGQDHFTIDLEEFSISLSAMFNKG